MHRIIFVIFGLIISNTILPGQVKFILEDFEGYADKQTRFRNGLFSFGSVELETNEKFTTGNNYSGERAIKVSWKKQSEIFGGWGKGISRNIELNPETDYFNFYIAADHEGKADTLDILIQEDDDMDNEFNKYNDDIWRVSYIYSPENEWSLVSIPLKKFKDDNSGGDGKFNIGYDDGKLFSIIVKFNRPVDDQSRTWYIDFLSFSENDLHNFTDGFTPKTDDKNAKCLLGAWSETKQDGDLAAIPKKFESYFNDKNSLAVVHFFQPFSMKATEGGYLYPSFDDLNKVIDQGYIPMLTLENHFIETSGYQQPNLYSIVEGHYDGFFREWAQRIKKVKGNVLVRLLHEFNGDWYSWSLIKNDQNPDLYVRAFRHICDIMKNEGVKNVRYIWCPNSMSIPQASWNYILKAYPGNEYIDYVGLDVYNGAGERGTPIWRSFRTEVIEGYYLLTKNFPDKQLLICETASRERQSSERGNLQQKSGWIRQMSEALQTDLSKIKLLTWFDEYKQFEINSSEEAKESFEKNIWNEDYFTSSNLKEWLARLNNTMKK